MPFKNHKDRNRWHNQYWKKNRATIKEYLNKIKESKGCEVCGEKRSACLDFHHKDRKDKEICLGDIRVMSLERIHKEIDKCIVICANCHRILHSTEMINESIKKIKEEKFPLFD